MDKFTLKPLSKDAIPSALAKAERYRLLNEPGQAESICLDVLGIEPDNGDARAILLLSITDQFPQHASPGLPARAEELTHRISDPYEREYYAGIIHERRAKAALRPRAKTPVVVHDAAARGMSGDRVQQVALL